MEFAQIQYTKTVEGNYEVTLVHNNTVVARITFPTEALASEYVDLKQKLKTQAEALIAGVTESLINKVKAVIPEAEKKVVTSEAAPEASAPEPVTKTQEEPTKVKVEKTKPIDTSAKIGVQPTIDTSAKVGKDFTIDTSAKIVVP